MDRRMFHAAFASGIVAALLQACSVQPPARGSLASIEHIVVIYPENRSFDHLYGLFPGADGIANATPEQYTQVDDDGTPLPYLPPVFGADGKPDARYPARLPNRPFQINAPPVDAAPDKLAPSPIHAFYQNQEQIAGGRNNRFVASSNIGGWARCSPTRCFISFTNSTLPNGLRGMVERNLSMPQIKCQRSQA